MNSGKAQKGNNRKLRNQKSATRERRPPGAETGSDHSAKQKELVERAADLAIELHKDALRELERH